MGRQKIIMKYHRLEAEKIFHNLVSTCFHHTNQLNIKRPFLSYLVLSENHIYQLMSRHMTIKEALQLIPYDDDRH